VFAMVVVIAFIVAAAYTATTLGRVAAQWNLRRHGHGTDAAALEERLARLEASVEGLGVQTQRLTDGHRFFTELLTNRPPAAVGGGAIPDTARKGGTT
jgi:hypothetical protein